MEENVALDSKKQKKFDKSIKGIKKLLKKNEEKPHKPAVLAPRDDDGKDDKKKRHKERGLVYLSHIPHGFYEHEMSQYFKQFGVVTNVRVVRSARSGRSKGFAFVEFREPAVADIVAETMNNYLMGKRLIKAAIVPPEKQKLKAFKKRWSIKNNPTTTRRVRERKAHNAPKTDAEHLMKAKKMLTNLKKNMKKLSDLGIDYSFFAPVDVPKELSEKVESEKKEVKVKRESEAKINNEPDAKLKKNKKSKAKETEEKLTKDKKVETKTKPGPKNKKDKVQETDKAKQNEKQKRMQKAGVTLPEEFIKVGEEPGESDSSLEFDSDEFEKMLKNDSSSGEESDEEGEDESDDGGEESDDGEDESDDGEDESDGEEESDDEGSEEELLPVLIPVKEKKGKKPAQKQLVQKAAKPNTPKVQKPQEPQVLKRKNPQPEVSPKKPKFEKKDKPRNKQFKKKNKA